MLTQSGSRPVNHKWQLVMVNSIQCPNDSKEDFLNWIFESLPIGGLKINDRIKDLRKDAEELEANCCIGPDWTCHNKSEQNWLNHEGEPRAGKNISCKVWLEILCQQNLFLPHFCRASHSFYRRKTHRNSFQLTFGWYEKRESSVKSRQIAYQTFISPIIGFTKITNALVANRFDSLTFSRLYNWF